MYVAMIGEAARRHWSWAIVMAVGLELGMLLTPYPGVFGIRVTPTFVAVTLIGASDLWGRPGTLRFQDRPPEESLPQKRSSLTDALSFPR